MAQAAIAIDQWAERRRRTLELKACHPFAAELLDFYGALLGVQELAYERTISARPPAGQLIAFVAEIVAPAVIDLSSAAGPAALSAELAHRLETTPVEPILTAWVRGEDQVMVDRFLARASLGPALEALGAEAAALCDGPRDARHCPRCGGPPQLSYFAIASDDLASGGRYLLCARCGASWGYARLTCAGCGEDSSARLPIFSEEGTTSGERGSVVRGLPAGAGGPDGTRPKAVFPHIRIEACEACLRYLLGIDLAGERAAVPLVDELAALPLDLYARERGFSKIIPNLMGF